jgi:hypothetical protein
LCNKRKIIIVIGNTSAVKYGTCMNSHL